MTRGVDRGTLTKWQALVDLIVSLTKKGKLSWKETASESAVLTAYGGYVFTIEKSRTDSMIAETLYKLTVTDRDGKDLDTFTDEDLDADSRPAAYFQKIDDLFLFIRRRISGADQVLDKLIKEMSEDDSDLPF